MNTMLKSTQAAFDGNFGGLTPPPKKYDAEVLKMDNVLRAFAPLAGTQAAGLAKIHRRQRELCAVHDFLEAATLRECKSVLDSLTDRVSTLTGSASELEDAASAIADDLEFEACPAKCRCDSCEAARSDESYDRRRDGQMTRA